MSNKPDYSSNYFRTPKQAKPHRDVSDAWWYAGSAGLEVFVQIDGKTQLVSIERRQLKTLFKHMFPEAS